MSGSLAFPEQDPADLRAQAVHEQFDAIRSAFVRYRLAHAAYTKAAVYGHGSPSATWEKVVASEKSLQKAISSAQSFTLDALEEAQVPAIHDKEES